MELISNILTWIFMYLFYPAIVIGIFVYVILAVAAIVRNGRTPSAIARRLTGSLIPLVVLIFVIVQEGGGPNYVAELTSRISPFLSFIAGAAVGIGLMESGKRLLATDDEVGPSLYSLFLSSLGVFVLYSIMIGFLRSLHLPLLGMVLAGGLDIVFRGPPSIE